MKLTKMQLLFDDYHYQIIDETEFFKIFSENRSKVFESNVDFNVKTVLSEIEKTQLKTLKNNYIEGYKLFIKITKNESLVGWFFGVQVQDETFRMINTGILKEYRNQGIYKNFLNKVLEILKEQGFQKVESHHHATNNQVIVPKLKAGFVITGLEIEDKFGTLLKLTYFFNEKRKEIVEFRVGHKRLSNKLSDSINLIIQKDH